MSSRASDENGPLYVVSMHRYMGNIKREWLENAASLRDAKLRFASTDSWSNTTVRRATADDVDRLRA